MTLIILCLAATGTSFAQGHQGTARVFVYSDIALGIGAPMGFRATANCLFLNHHEIGMGYNAYWHRGPDVPEGAKYGQQLAPSLTDYPQETLDGLAFTYAYVLYPKERADQLRYLLRAGLVVGQHENPYNFRLSTGGWSGTIWSHDVTREQAIAFIFQPTIDFTPCKGFGLTAGAYLLLQKAMNGGGIMLSIQPGKVGNHYRYHSPEALTASRARHERKMFWKKKKK